MPCIHYFLNVAASVCFYSGPEWDTIPKGQLSHHRKDDGEFWIELNDFMKYFSGVTICSMTPDFDQDGCEDTISEFLIFHTLTNKVRNKGTNELMHGRNIRSGQDTSQ